MYTIEQIIEFLQNDICNFLMEPGQGNPPQRYLTTIANNAGNNGIAFSGIDPINNTFNLHFGGDGNFQTINTVTWQGAIVRYMELQEQVILGQIPPYHQTTPWNTNPMYPYLGALLLFIDNNHPHHNYADLGNLQEEFLALRNQIFGL
jgi:hypothetical protein